MIRRYLPNETNFNHNKYILHPLSSEVYEEANGMFELKMELQKKEAITSGDIISAPTPRGDQLFRVYRITKSLQGKKIYARHIFYDLANAFLIDTRPTNATVQDALQSIFTSIPLSGWTYLSDIVDRKTAYYIRKNPVEAIIGAENSILNHWGGNLVRNNKEVKILAEGIDRGFEIRLGKNLLGIEDDSDESAIVTRLYPTVVIDQVVHALPEQFVDSPLITNYPNIVTKEVRVNLSEEDLLLPIEDIYEIMREFCENLYAIDAVDKPQVNYTVDFVQLKKIARLNQEINYTYEGLQQLTYETIETLTYDQLQGTQVINQFIDLLEQLDLYDLVKIRVKELDIDLQARVVSYKYDCLSGNFKSIELGGFKQAVYYQTQNLIQKIANDLQVSKGDISKIWDTAVNIVTGNKGGYKVDRLNSNNQPYETLYMDTPDINTAQSILRINNAGIAGTDSGINGPYELAMTTSGWIRGERIAAYSLSVISANLGTVTTGKIQSESGKLQINLDDDIFEITSNTDDKVTFAAEGLEFSSLVKPHKTKIDEGYIRIENTNTGQGRTLSNKLGFPVDRTVIGKWTVSKPTSLPPTEYTLVNPVFNGSSHLNLEPYSEFIANVQINLPEINPNSTAKVEVYEAGLDLSYFIDGGELYEFSIEFPTTWELRGNIVGFYYKKSLSGFSGVELRVRNLKTASTIGPTTVVAKLRITHLEQG